MSIRIIKPGIMDTIQDGGLYGYQHLGINPGGAMDTIAMGMANAMVGNTFQEAVLEMHFPAAIILFEKDMMIALSGADGGAIINDQPISIDQPVIVDGGSVLRFTKMKKGARIYLAIQGGFDTGNWLGSQSTHLKLKTGGFNGGRLQKGDTLVFKKEFAYHFSGRGNAVALPWHINMEAFYLKSSVRFIAGREYNLLTNAAQQLLNTALFTIAPQSDRMGYRLSSAPLQLMHPCEMISSGVGKGTMQLLPNGQLIVLMADHQTSGGYPRAGCVISADIPSLAQMSAGHSFSFVQVSLTEAENIWYHQQMHLQQLQNACNFRLDQYSGSRSFIKT